MTRVTDLAKALRSLNLRAELPKMIERQKQVPIDINRDQLLHGLTSEGETGTNLRGYRNFDYAVKKNQMNSLPEFGVADLKLTGAFYSKFDLKADATTYTLFSSDPKADELELSYTLFIFGIQGRNIYKWADALFINEIKPYIEGKTGLLMR